MRNKFFKQDFDIKEYTTEKTLEIKNLSDRSAYKEIVKNLIIDLYTYHENSYEKLCDEIMSEVDSIETENPVYIGISKQSDYDETDEFLFPIIETDFYKKKISTNEIKEIIEENSKCEIGKFYYNGDLSSLNKFKDGKKNFKGKIITTKGEYSVEFSLEFDSSYIEEVKNLYKSFKFNMKRWFPICTAYLMRFFKVYIVEINSNKIEGEYISFSSSFLENTSNIELDVFPVWNICKTTAITSIYPKPVKEKLIYEHKVFAHLLNEKSEYLLTNNNPEVIQVLRNKGDLLIRTPEELAIEWNVIEIRPFIAGAYKNEIISSEYIYKDIDKFLNIYKSQVKTKSEIIRFTNNLPFGDYIELKNIEVAENRNEVFDTYSMDNFEEDEIRSHFSKNLILYFEKSDKEHVFISDFMSFYVTHIQKIFPEYRCVGKFI